MRRPLSGRTGPDDWQNTGAISCITGRRVARIVFSARQFQRLPIPPSRILVQPDPASGHTLVNVPTNLLTSRRAVVLRTSVLGQPVRVRATPAQFRWQYGDGEHLTTENPGHPYPDMPTAHVYRQPGSFTVRLSTTFTGEFAVGSGPWQPITGIATTRSQPSVITADEHRAVLVS